MPGMPIGEMFRSFKSPAGWGGHYLEPDLTAFGLLKREHAALFVEYDGYYRHATKEGREKDLVKNAALLKFVPAGSFGVRIGHTGRSQLKESVLWVRVNPWRRGDHLLLTRALRKALEETALRLKHALHPDAHRSLKAHLNKERPLVISQSAQDFCKAAIAEGKGNTTEEIASHLSAEGFEDGDIHQLQQRALGGGASIERTLQPRLQWFLHLGLTKSQIAKAVARHPNILGYSIERNFEPTVQWFLDWGLTESQVAKAVARHPPILWYRTGPNLKPKTQWFLDLGLTKSQVATLIADFSPILGLSIENLSSKVKLLQSFLTSRGATELIAQWPLILTYSQQRLENRLHILAGQDSLAKVVSAMVLTDEAFHKRFLAQKQGRL